MTRSFRQRTASAILSGVLGLLLAFAAPDAQAQSFSDAVQQAAQCKLQYTATTRSEAAIAMIRNACNDLYNPIGLSTDARHAYDTCLLQYLSGAQSDAAAAQIAKACADMYPRF
jgi:hypothetical protein